MGDRNQELTDHVTQLQRNEKKTVKFNKNIRRHTAKSRSTKKEKNAVKTLPRPYDTQPRAKRSISKTPHDSPPRNRVKA